MDIHELKDQLEGRNTIEQFNILTGIFPGKVLFTSSFGMEDQVITHQIFNNDLPVEVVTLDTGRLFPETYKVFNETLKRYQKPIQVYLPDHSGVEEMLKGKGPFSFYRSVEDRMECCHLRKVIPLNRALAGMKIWISGIRASQSDNRKKMDWLEYDADKKLFKFYPLFNWSFEEVKEFIKANQVPYNILHNKGFISIGCQPCTRAIEPGQDFRAGRWWWETGGSKECGCHIN
jgi:phosphoadenosine phosphosulfate reductase